MPTLEVTTRKSENTWTSPDGKIKMYNLELDYQGKPVTAKTYSGAIAAVGWSGTVETYEKPNKSGGSDTFVKQPAREDGAYQSGGSSHTDTQGSRSYPQRDDSHIKAQWAIGQAVIILGEDKINLDIVEGLAKDLFAMVDRVKSGAVTPDVVAPMPEDDSQVSLGDLLGEVKEDLTTEVDDLWPKK